MPSLITKASGEQETFNIDKVTSSLSKIGVDTHTITLVKGHIENLPDISTTERIRKETLLLIEKINRPLAYKYNLKYALAAMGPTGYPFEKFIAEIFRHLGYDAKTGRHLQGACVNHEIDVVAKKDIETVVVECKFRNQPFSKVDVRVPLYVHSRFEDIREHMESQGNTTQLSYWIATNAKFTEDAIHYSRCKNIHLLGWSYPVQGNINGFIDTYGLYPVTAITLLTTEEQAALITHGVILAKQLPKQKELLRNVGISEEKIALLERDIAELCN